MIDTISLSFSILKKAVWQRIHNSKKQLDFPNNTPHTNLMFRDYSKNIKKELQRLAEMAYERELASHLKKLYRSFKKWDKEQLDTIVLSNMIEKYHNNDFSKIRSKYDTLDPDELVAFGLVKKFLTAEDLSKEIRDKFLRKAELYKNL